MNHLSANELFIGLFLILVSFLVGFGFGYVFKECREVDISDVIVKSQELEKERDEAVQTLKSLSDDYEKEVGFSQGLLSEVEFLRNKKPETFIERVIKWRDKPVYISSGECNGRVGTDGANMDNAVIYEAYKQVKP